MAGDTAPRRCSSVSSLTRGQRRHSTSRHFSPPRMPVSQSCTNTTRGSPFASMRRPPRPTVYRERGEWQRRLADVWPRLAKMEAAFPYAPCRVITYATLASLVFVCPSRRNPGCASTGSRIRLARRRSATRATVQFQVGGWGHVEYLSGGKWLFANIEAKDVEAKIPADGALLSYDFEVKTAGDYEVWARVGHEFVRSPFSWRLDKGGMETQQIGRSHHGPDGPASLERSRLA